MYKAILFDFDYTLVDSHIGIVKCYRNVLQRHGYNHVDDIAIQRTIGKTLEESFSLLTGIKDAQQLENLRQEYRKEADIYMTPNTFLFPDTIDTLKELKNRNYKLGIISTKYRFRFMDTMNKYLPANFFDVLIGNEDIVKPKPDPEGLYTAMHLLNVQAYETIYVGDSTVDGETALRAKTSFIGVTTGMTEGIELSNYPHLAIVPSLHDILSTI